MKKKINYLCVRCACSVFITVNVSLPPGAINWRFVNENARAMRSRISKSISSHNLSVRGQQFNAFFGSAV